MLVKKLIELFGAFFTAKKVVELATQDNSNYDTLYKKHASKHNVDWKLVKAIAQVESSENPSAVNPSDPSYGMMQILCMGTSQRQPYCTNKLPAIPEWEGTTYTDLYDVDYNISIGTQILADNIKKYGLRKGVAVYNNWSARLQTEPFSNQGYVNKVFDKYNKLKGA